MIVRSLPPRPRSPLRTPLEAMAILTLSPLEDSAAELKDVAVLARAPAPAPDPASADVSVPDEGAAALAPEPAPAVKDSSSAAAFAPAPASAAKASGSVYDLRSRRAKNVILAGAACISILTPFTDTVYLPALGSVRSSLGGSADAVAASVSVYMAAVGLLSLFWGPLSDRYGRRIPLIVSIALYLAATVACPFSPGIGALIVLRALEGAFVGSTISVTQGIVSDTFAPHERGTALGIFFLPLLVGPIVAPIVGGLLSAALDWRATFYLLVALGAAVFVIAAYLPETQHFIVQTERRKQLAAAGAAAEAVVDEGDSVAGEFVAPWVPLSFMLEREILPFVAVSGANFACMFVSLTLMPMLLAAPPYNLGEGLIGVCYLPIGIAMMVGSLAGGVAADAAAAASPGLVSARLRPSVLGALALPVGCIVFGFVLWAGAPFPVALLVGQTLIGWGQSYFMGGFMAYLTTVKQRQASSASAGSLTVNFVLAAVLISAAIPLQAALGTEGLFALLAGVHAAVSLAAWMRLSLWRREWLSAQGPARDAGVALGKEAPAALVVAAGAGEVEDS